MILADVTETCISCSNAGPGISPALALLLGMLGFVGLFSALAGAGAGAVSGAAGASGTVGAPSPGAAPGGGVAGETGGKEGPEIPRQESDHQHAPSGPDADQQFDTGEPVVPVGPPVVTDGTVTTHYSDGSTTYEDADGTTRINADDSIEVERTDGSTEYYPPGSKGSTTVDAQGGVTTTSGDGTTSYGGPEGTSTLHPDGSSDATRPVPDDVRIDAHGNPVEVRPGDIAEHRDVDGTKTVSHSDGTVDVTRPDETFTSTGPEGTTEVNRDKSIDVTRGNDYEHHTPGGKVYVEWGRFGVSDSTPDGHATGSAQAGKTPDSKPAKAADPPSKDDTDP